MVAILNKKCGHRLWLTRYAPISLWWHRYSIGPRRLRLITWPCNLDLWPRRSWRLLVMRVVVLHPYTKFKVRRPCRSEDMTHNVCQHWWAWWPWPLTIWPWNWYVSRTKGGHARPLSSRIIRYVHDGWTDKSNAYCPLLYGWGHNNSSTVHSVSRQQTHVMQHNTKNLDRMNKTNNTAHNVVWTLLHTSCTPALRRV